MAGIGFELRQLLKNDSFFGMLRTYVYAGIISSGPWVISILAMLFLGIFSLSFSSAPKWQITQFQTSVTYLIAGSLIFTGLVQLAFTRYIADQLYNKLYDTIFADFLGLLLITTTITSIVASIIDWFFFNSQTIPYQILMVGSFIILCNIWVTTILLSGLKKYKSIVFAFFISYGLIIILGMQLKNYGLIGLLLAFFSGNLLLLVLVIYAIAKEYSWSKKISFAFFNVKKIYWSLVITGILYNLGLWADKFIFWYNPYTSHLIIGPLRASALYDLPIFLAYLSIIPGMAIFLIRMETDFVEYYQKFFKYILEGGSLALICEMRINMMLVARQGILEIIKIQAVAVMVIFVIGPTLLTYLNISPLYLYLLNIDVVSAGLQVIFLALINVLFYLDKRTHALLLTLLFTIANICLTQLSINLGPHFFGYGFAVALLITVSTGMYVLNEDFLNFEYETFMLRG